MASSIEMNDRREMNRGVLQIPFKKANDVLINTIVTNIINTIVNIDKFRDPKACKCYDKIHFYFSFAVDYLGTMKTPTILYLIKSRPFLDFFDKLKELAFKAKELEKTAPIIYPILEAKLKFVLFSRGSVLNTDNYPENKSEKHCENCKIEISSGKLRTANDCLDYEDEEDEEMWIDYLGHHLKYVKERCSCNNFNI